MNIKPNLLIFDGNGILHKREFGLASHMGVLEKYPTIGLAKKLHLVDSFPYKNLNEFKSYYKPLLKNAFDSCELKTVDGKRLGCAYLSAPDSTDPVFISQGQGYRCARLLMWWSWSMGIWLTWKSRVESRLWAKWTRWRESFWAVKLVSWKMIWAFFFEWLLFDLLLVR